MQGHCGFLMFALNEAVDIYLTSKCVYRRVFAGKCEGRQGYITDPEGICFCNYHGLLYNAILIVTISKKIPYIRYVSKYREEKRVCWVDFLSSVQTVEWVKTNKFYFFLLSTDLYCRDLTGFFLLIYLSFFYLFIPCEIASFFVLNLCSLTVILVYFSNENVSINISHLLLIWCRETRRDARSGEERGCLYTCSQSILHGADQVASELVS